MSDIDRSLNTSQLIFKTANVRLTMTSSVRSRYNVRIALKWKFIFFCLLSVHSSYTHKRISIILHHTMQHRWSTKRCSLYAKLEYKKILFSYEYIWINSYTFNFNLRLRYMLYIVMKWIFSVIQRSSSLCGCYKFDRYFAVCIEIFIYSHSWILRYIFTKIFVITFLYAFEYMNIAHATHTRGLNSLLP